MTSLAGGTGGHCISRIFLKTSFLSGFRSRAHPTMLLGISAATFEQLFNYILIRDLSQKSRPLKISDILF